MSIKEKKTLRPGRLARLSKSRNLSLVIFAVVFVLAGTLALQRLNAAPKQRINGVTFYLTPASQTLSVGNETTLQIWVDTQEKSTNAVQTNLTYDINYFDFVAVDPSNSAFSIEAESTGGGGTVRIARGSIEPHSGKNLVATVKLRAKARVKKTQLQFNSSSVVAETITAANILVTRSSGTYRIN